MKKKVGRPPLKIKKVVASVRVLESTKRWYKDNKISMGQTLEDCKNVDRLAFVEWNIEQLKHLLELYKDSVLMQTSYSNRLKMYEAERKILIDERNRVDNEKEK